MIKSSKIIWETIGVKAECRAFQIDGGAEEVHAILHVEPRGELFTAQLSRIYEGESLLCDLPEMKDAKVVMKRYFLSDSTNQQPLMRKEEECSVSMIQQAPLDGSKIAVWIYLVKGAEVSCDDESAVVTHNGYRHIWTMGLVNNDPVNEQSSYGQTWNVMQRYIDILGKYNATLEANCVRTWFFVRDVDTQYGGLVKSRRECFTQQGLTPQTHYISSTGIGGNPADPKALIQLGCYAMTGFEPEQQKYLYALSHLNKTIEYGVTFERGTLMEYGDRGHIFISGTASINNKGEVVHVGDIVKQTHRMWENVEALLAEGGMSYDNVMQVIVYLRDTADYDIVSKMFEEKFPDTPYVITLAPVCRPTWLIEMECIAVDERTNAQFRNF